MKLTPPLILVTTFSAHQDIFHKLIGNNCHFLSEDPIICKYVADRPEIVCRRSRSIRDSLIHSHFPPATPSLGATGGKGTYKCGNCNQFPWMKKRCGMPPTKSWFSQIKNVRGIPHHWYCLSSYTPMRRI